MTVVTNLFIVYDSTKIILDLLKGIYIISLLINLVIVFYNRLKASLKGVLVYLKHNE